MRQILQNETAISLQNATEDYYKMRQVFIKKCDSYHKMRRLLQIATVHALNEFRRKTKLTAIQSIQKQLCLSLKSINSDVH